MNEYFKVMIFQFSVIFFMVSDLVLLPWDYAEEYVTQIKTANASMSKAMKQFQKKVTKQQPNK